MSEEFPDVFLIDSRRFKLTEVLAEAARENRFLATDDELIDQEEISKLFEATENNGQPGEA